MDNTRNALAELAERLETHIVPIVGCVGSSATGRAIADDIRTAQRIVAELANADKIYIDDCVNNSIVDLAYNALRKCRAIAEGGESVHG